MRRFLLSFVTCLSIFLYLGAASSANTYTVVGIIRPSPVIWQFTQDFGNYRMVGPPPVIYIVPASQLSAAYCPGKKCILDGMYDPDTGRLFVSIDAALYRQDVTVVHELMHFLQDRAGKTASDCEHEREAFAAHNYYGVWVLGTGKVDPFPAKFYGCAE